MDKLTTEKQYEVTKSWIKRFGEAIKEIEQDCHAEHDHDVWHPIEIASHRSMMEDLEQQAREYEQTQQSQS